MWLKFLNIDEL